MLTEVPQPDGTVHLVDKTGRVCAESGHMEPEIQAELDRILGPCFADQMKAADRMGRIDGWLSMFVYLSLVASGVAYLIEVWLRG